MSQFRPIRTFGRGGGGFDGFVSFKTFHTYYARVPSGPRPLLHSYHALISNKDSGTIVAKYTHLSLPA